MTSRKIMFIVLIGLVLFGSVGGVLAQSSSETTPTPLFVAALGQNKKTWSIVMLDPAADGPEYLTDDRYDEVAPLVSADSRYVVFLRGDFSTNDPLKYYVLDRNCLPKCQPKPLPDKVNQMADLRWSPVGPQLVAWGLDNAVWLIDVEANTVDQVITGSWFAKPSWSPDGSLIVVSSDVVPPNAMLSDDIQLIPAKKDADIKDLVNLSYSGKYVEETQPLYSPDGQWIAYLTKNLMDEPNDPFHDNPFALLMMNTDCIQKPTTCPDTRQLLSKDGHQVTNFAWSPNSRYVAYIDGDPLNPDNRYGDLWVVDVQSGKLRQFTTGKTTGEISWSPDSAAVAFERVTDSSYDVYMALISSKRDPAPVLDGFRASGNPLLGFSMTEGNVPFLTRPDVLYKISYLAALREFHREGRNLGWDYEEVSANFERFVRDLCNRVDYPPLGKVRRSILWLVHNGIFVGRLSLRHELTPNLLQFGGHIGYEIRPSMRRKGYGTTILRLGLEEAKKIGLKRALVTCDDINIASAKIIEANGGVLENIVLLEGHEVATKRYWIRIK